MAFDSARRPIRLGGEEVDRPGHICAFFDSRDEEYAALIPYFRDGLDADEQVVTVMDESCLADHIPPIVYLKDLMMSSIPPAAATNSANTFQSA
jgi:hypothetical protein